MIAILQRYEARASVPIMIIDDEKSWFEWCLSHVAWFIAIVIHKILAAEKMELRCVFSLVSHISDIDFYLCCLKWICRPWTVWFLSALKIYKKKQYWMKGWNGSGKLSMLQVNPKFILRNYLVWCNSFCERGDYLPFRRFVWMYLIKPFDEHPEIRYSCSKSPWMGQIVRRSVVSS